MRLAVLINHGGMAARRYFEPKVWLALPCQFDTGKEALGLGLARARCENNDIIFIGLKMSSDNGSDAYLCNNRFYHQRRYLALAKASLIVVRSCIHW